MHALAKTTTIVVSRRVNHAELTNRSLIARAKNARMANAGRCRKSANRTPARELNGIGASKPISATPTTAAAIASKQHEDLVRLGVWVSTEHRTDHEPRILPRARLRTGPMLFSLRPTSWLIC